MRRTLLRGFLSAALFLGTYLTHAQDGARLPVMANQIPATHRTVVQSKASKVIQPSSAQNKTADALAGGNVLVNNNNGATGTGQFTQSETPPSLLAISL